MNETGISWTDLTWNPVSGCEKISEGCKFCYADVVATQKKGTKAFPNGFALTYRKPETLNAPTRVPGSKRIFVNSMSDMFWEKISDEFRDKMVDVMERTLTRHQYQVLTKRPEEMLRYSLSRVARFGEAFPSNFWAGVTIENQRTAWRLDVLKQVQARIRFVSAEPLISPLELDLTDIHWLIAGGESGSQITNNPIGQSRALVEKRDGKWVPKDEAVEWIRALRNQCEKYGTKFFFKQWGGPQSGSGGRVLDERTWEEFPE